MSREPRNKLGLDDLFYYWYNVCELHTNMHTDVSDSDALRRDMTQDTSYFSATHMPFQSLQFQLDIQNTLHSEALERTMKHSKV